MQLDTAELLERIARIRKEVEALEAILLSRGADKSHQRKVRDLMETTNELEAGMTKGSQQ
jgi:hypothetical protein